MEYQEASQRYNWGRAWRERPSSTTLSPGMRAGLSVASRDRNVQSKDSKEEDDAVRKVILGRLRAIVSKAKECSSLESIPPAAEVHKRQRTDALKTRAKTELNFGKGRDALFT